MVSSVHGLAPDRRQAMNWTNGDLDIWRYMMSQLVKPTGHSMWYIQWNFCVNFSIIMPEDFSNFVNLDVSTTELFGDLAQYMYESASIRNTQYV